MVIRGLSLENEGGSKGRLNEQVARSEAGEANPLGLALHAARCPLRLSLNSPFT